MCKQDGKLETHPIQVRIKMKKKNELCHEKNNISHMRKQRRGSASQSLLS